MRFGIVTDIHHTPLSTPPGGFHNPYQFATTRDRLQRSISWFAAQGVERIAALGDLTNGGDADSMREVLEVLSGSGIPVWVVPGNHDLGETESMLADEVARMDHSALTVLDARPQRLGDTWSAIGTGLAFPATDGNWLATGLPDVPALGDHPLLILSHFPILGVAEQARAANLKYAGDMNNRAEVAAALASRLAPTVVLNGHLHLRYAQAAGPILQMSCGAQVESLFEATVVDLGDWVNGRISWESVAIDPVWDGPNPALSDPNQTWRWNGTAWLTEA